MNIFDPNVAFPVMLLVFIVVAGGYSSWVGEPENIDLHDDITQFPRTEYVK